MDLRLDGVDHPMQVCCCVFDAMIFDALKFVLSCRAFCRGNSTTVDIFEIAIRERIPSFGLAVFPFFDAQMPLPVLIKPVQADELILCL